VDNHVRSYEDELFDHYFLAHYHGPTYPVDPTRKDHTWLPCATDTKLFTPSPIAWADREYDICMVGVMYPRRVEVLNALKDAGFKVFAVTGLLYDEYRAAYHNSRISLCVSAAGDVAQRIFETGGMGCAILTDPLLDFGDEMTNKALHLFGRATYTTPQEAVNLARELLGHQPQAFQIDAIMPIENSALGEQAAREIQRNCLPHTWEARAQVIVNWFEREYGKDKQLAHPYGIPSFESLVNGTTAKELTQAIAAVSAELNKPVDPEPERKPYLNLGCGTTHFPGERPPGHEFIAESVYAYPDWLNVDKVKGVGADKVFDLFAYPWPLESNSFDGAILGHIAEHIPHEIKQSLATNFIKNGMDSENFEAFYFERYKELSILQDGWYAFFSELYRVLTPGAIVHIISPYAWSQGTVTDPTHTRLLTEHTFSHGLAPDQYTGTFKYNIDCNFAIDGHQLRYSPWAQPFMNDPDMLATAIMTRINMVYDFYVKLRAVK
jgi:SAM-dependent methyltransferase